MLLMHILVIVILTAYQNSSSVCRFIFFSLQLLTIVQEPITQLLAVMLFVHC